jgi:hypothetical protein
MLNYARHCEEHMSKEQSKVAIVESFAERCVFTVSRHWIMTREYSHNGMIVRDFLNDKLGLNSSVVEINGEFFATDD